MSEENQAELLMKVAGYKDRNSLCPCGSGRKFKKCCGFVWKKAQQERIKLARAG